MSFDKAAFFKSVRAGILGPTLDPDEVAGCEGILDAAVGLPIGWVAYILGTAYHETQGHMCGKQESLDYSAKRLQAVFGAHRITAAQAQAYGRVDGVRPADQKAIANTIYGGAWGKLNLGNTQPNDGWYFRGRGGEHVTGRASYKKVDDELNLGGALMLNPDMLDDPKLAGKVIVSGMTKGRYRRHKLADFLPKGLATIEQFTPARAIINPDGNGKLVARHAWNFQNGLQAGRWV